MRMELKLEIFSARNWFSGFKGIQSSEHQYNCEKGKKPMTSLVGSSAKKGTEKLPMRCSRVEDRGDSSKGKAVFWGSEVEELSERLKILEEETGIMKEALLWSMEERRNMMNEICQQFQLLQYGCLQTRNHLVIEESSCVNPFEDERVIKRLPSIQIPDPKSCVLTRELKANALAFQEPARCSLCRGHIKVHHD